MLSARLKIISLAALVVLAGCTSTRSDNEPPLIAYPSPPADPLTGFGALKAYWDFHRTPDPRYPGTVYGRQDGLNTEASGVDFKYGMVNVNSENRIDSYTLVFPTNLPFDLARQQAVDELPPDAAMQWERTSSTCYQAQYRSQTLADVMPTTTRDGQVLLSFTNYDSVTGDYLGTFDVLDDVIIMPGTSPDPADAFTC